MDAARQCTWQWISGHDPSCGATPMIRVARINGKTTPRHITLFPPFAYLLWEWSTGKPLVAKTGEQWPATGQSIEPNMPLFPGYCADGQKRCWDKPISARAYLGKIHEAARSLTQDKTAASAMFSFICCC